MTDENLRKLLEQLHDELERAESVDEKGDELLRHLNADIRGLLKRSEKGKELSDESTLERLEAAIDYSGVTQDPHHLRERCSKCRMRNFEMIYCIL